MQKKLKAPKARALARSQLKAYTLKLWKEQGGKCPVCEGDGKNNKGVFDICLDHCHESGQCRGALCRSCNGALGKMENAVGRWGAGGMEYSKVIPWIRRALEYYDQPQQPYLYPGHKSPEEVQEARRVRRNKLAAQRRARQRAKDIGK